MIKSHKDLIVWQKGKDLVELIYDVTKTFPSNEQFGLVSQLRRAVVSIPSNIAEGYGRQSTGNYKQFLSISRGSLLELETQIILSILLKYLEKNKSEIIVNKIEELSKMLSSLISKIK
jgi:four helix bundle protein